jgi:hypothetical protein
VILAAGLLLLVGLGLLVAGVATGVTALYWACVAVCVVAAVLLFVVRRRLATESQEASDSESHTAASHDVAPRTAPPADRERQSAAEPVGEEPADAPAQAGPPPAAEPGIAERPSTAPDLGTETGMATGAHARPPADAHSDEAPLEEVEVTDLLLVVDLHDEVLVIDEHPRYHLSGCVYLTGRTTIPLPIDEARGDGFTPCGSCSPDRTLAQRVRAGRAAGSS